MPTSPAATHFGRELEQVHVAGVAFVPDAGDADLRLVHVRFGQAGAVEHRLRRALRLGLGDVAAPDVELAFLGHDLRSRQVRSYQPERESPF